MSLSGRIALVTGASRGIGRAIAVSLADAGADLIVTTTRAGGTDGLLRRIEASGRRAVEVVYDAAQTGSADELVGRAIEAFGRVDVLVNNAGIVVRRRLDEMTDADFERVLSVNLTAPFKLARRLAPAMAKRGFGRVVNVSSISGTLGTPHLTAYCASKWGLNGLTKAMAEELRGSGVFVAAVLPGSVDTDMLKGSGFSPQMSPEEVAGVVRYLCESAPMAMHGSLVEVFG